MPTWGTLLRVTGEAALSGRVQAEAQAPGDLGLSELSVFLKSGLGPVGFGVH